MKKLLKNKLEIIKKINPKLFQKINLEIIEN